MGRRFRGSLLGGSLAMLLCAGSPAHAHRAPALEYALQPAATACSAPGGGGCCPVQPDVRTQGFWRRQCAGPHPSGEHDNLPGYVSCVAQAATFPVASVAALCDRLEPQPHNDKCEQAEAQFMALLLNVCSGRVATCNCVLDPDLGAATVATLIATLDGLLANPARTRSDCVRAQAVADRLNQGTSLQACGSTAGGGGCSDGTREGFLDPGTHPNIAGCSGGWSIPGVLGTTLSPACGRVSGNSSPNPFGSGCNVADLCAVGWHVCASAADVAAHSPTGCAGAATDDLLFFATRQSSNGCAVCATGTRTDPDCDGAACSSGCCQTDLLANDVFGCGNLGDPIANPDCGVLDRFSNNGCLALPAPWQCLGTNGFDEARRVTKFTSGRGGVLCCRDCTN